MRTFAINNLTVSGEIVVKKATDLMSVVNDLKSYATECPVAIGFAVSSFEEIQKKDILILILKDINGVSRKFFEIKMLPLFC